MGNHPALVLCWGHPLLDFRGFQGLKLVLFEANYGRLIPEIQSSSLAANELKSWNPSQITCRSRFCWLRLTCCCSSHLLRLLTSYIHHVCWISHHSSGTNHHFSGMSGGDPAVRFVGEAQVNQARICVPSPKNVFPCPYFAQVSLSLASALFIFPLHRCYCIRSCELSIPSHSCPTCPELHHLPIEAMCANSDGVVTFESLGAGDLDFTIFAFTLQQSISNNHGSTLPGSSCKASCKALATVHLLTVRRHDDIWCAGKIHHPEARFAGCHWSHWTKPTTWTTRTRFASCAIQDFEPKILCLESYMHRLEKQMLPVPWDDVCKSWGSVSAKDHMA